MFTLLRVWFSPVASSFPLCPLLLCVLPSPPLPCGCPLCGSVCISLVPSYGVTSQGIATGKYHAAVLTNSAEWEAACVKAGRKCGDLVHPLVYCPELHFSEFTSAVADMKNSVAVGLEWLPHQMAQNRHSPALRESVSPLETAIAQTRLPSPTLRPQICAGRGHPKEGCASPGVPCQRVPRGGYRGSSASWVCYPPPVFLLAAPWVKARPVGSQVPLSYFSALGPPARPFLADIRAGDG